MTTKYRNVKVRACAECWGPLAFHSDSSLVVRRLCPHHPKASEITFDSKREHRYGLDLKILERTGKIDRLELHPKYPIFIDHEKLCDVFLDFSYFEDGVQHHIDVKGKDNALSKLKRKALELQYRGVKVELA